VAILARDCNPVLTHSSLPRNPDDRQARYIEAVVNGVLIASIYLPNGNPQPGPKLKLQAGLVRTSKLHWTFWDYKQRDRWPADKSMRLDHLLLSQILSERLVDGGVDRWVRGEENASDHAPAWIMLDL
jgi:exonuclease III